MRRSSERSPPCFVLIAMHWLISLGARGWPRLGWLVKGQSDLLIKNGKVDRGELKRAHMTDDDLAEDLRQKGVGDPTDVKEARLERDGVLSVIKR